MLRLDMGLDKRLIGVSVTLLRNAKGVTALPVGFTGVEGRTTMQTKLIDVSATGMRMPALQDIDMTVPEAGEGRSWKYERQGLAAKFRVEGFDEFRKGLKGGVK